jgi:hypothetical protein
MKNVSKRNSLRWVHIFAGSVIATYVYSPLSESNGFSFFTKAIVIPLLIATGLWLWKGQFFRKLLLKKGAQMALMLILSMSTIISVQAQEVEKPATHRWGAEFSAIGIGVFSLYQGKATYAFNPDRQFKTEIGLGFLIQPESTRKTSDAFNTNGTYSAYQASVGVRQYFWKGLHFEEVINFGQAGISDSKVDGQDYESFVVFTQTFLGYKFDLLTRDKFNVFMIGQGGIGYVPLSTNSWPTVDPDDSPVYPLGDLKIGVNF